MSTVKVKYSFDAKGCGKAAQAAPAPPSRAARMLALAYHIERLVEAGELGSYAEAARVLGVSRARMGQVVSMLNLSAGIQGAILLHRVSFPEREIRRLARTSGWDEQTIPVT